MTGISSSQGASALLTDYEIKNKQIEQNKSDKNQFLELMIAQLNNQDPLSPQENGEFLAQLAQFSSVDGIERLNETLSTFTSEFKSQQALQATSLVGRQVVVPSNSGWLEGQGIAGSVELDTSSSDVQVQISTVAGEVVRNLPLGLQSKGNVNYHWDGADDKGNPMPPGEYLINAKAQGDDGTYALVNYVKANVDSVSINGNGSVSLNVPKVGSVQLNDVKHIE